MAGDLGGHIRSERSGAGFEVAEVTIKRRKRRARADDAKVDGDAAGLAEKILRGIHQFAAQASALARWVHTKEAEIATVSAKFEVDASCEARGLLSQQEFPFFHVGADAVGIGAITIDEGLLDAEGAVDQASQGFHVRKGRYAETQGVLLRSRFGGVIHAGIGILTRTSMISSLRAGYLEC
jgi:hypothetical protein